MQNYQIAMVKELSIVLGINHQELPEHPSDQNKGLSAHQRRLFSNTYYSKIVTAIFTYLESNITSTGKYNIQIFCRELKGD